MNLEDKMDAACNTHGTDENCTQFLSQNMQGRDHLRDLNVHWTITLKSILK